MDQHINKALAIIGMIMLAFTLFFHASAETTKNTAANQTIDFENLYESLHTDFKNNYTALDSIAQKYVGGNLGASATEVQKMMTEDPSSCGDTCLLNKYCPKKSNLFTVQECKKMIISEVAKRKAQLITEKEMHDNTIASQAFMNGTLQDTGNKAYDLVVDLNIIDLLFFGDKMSVPTNGSPFLPKDGNEGKNPSGEPSLSLLPTTSEGAHPSPSSSISNTPTPSSSSSPFPSSSTSPLPSGFCMVPNSFSGKVDTTLKDGNGSTGNSSDTSLGSNLETSLGNIVDDRYKFRGGTYPDLRKYQNKKKCGAGEKSFFYGRICIPEFCNEMICVKIDMKTTTKPASVSNLNCTECHIDRANTALDKMMGTLGQNTPNVNPMEPYFLRAIANLFKNVTSRITIIAKPLPFLVYDEALIADKTEGEKSDEQKAKEQEDQRKNDIAERNTNLYNQIVMACPEALEHFQYEEVSSDLLTQYCSKVDAERVQLEVTNQINTEIAEAKNEQKSISYNNVLKPFYQQTAAKIVTINELLKTITVEEIMKTNRNCKTTIQ